MSKLYWTSQDSAGNAVAGLTVTVHNPTSDALIGTMTGVGGGVYELTLATSQLVKIKENGTEKLTNFFHAAEDLASSVVLASTTFELGAHLIGISAPEAATNNEGDWTGQTLDGLLFDVMASYPRLASTANGEGGSLIGIEDVGGYYTAANLEDLLQELGPRMQLLAGLTATASELNKLDGAGSTVNAANLNALTDNTLTALHYHDRNSYVDNAIGNGGSASLGYDFTIYSGTTSLDTRGNILFDVFSASGDGTVYVRRSHPTTGLVTLFEVVDGWKVGALNFSGDVLLSGITGPGVVDECLKRLSRETRNLQVTAGVSYAIFDSGGTTAAATDGATAADPRATTLYYHKSATYGVKKSWALVQLPEHKTIELDGWFKGDAAGLTHVKLVCAGVEFEYKIPATSYGETVLSISLATIPVTIPTARDIEVYLKGDGTNGAYMAAWFQLRVTI